MKADIITIGDEILIGQIIDTNSALIAQKLNYIGVQVNQIMSIADSVLAIKNSLDLALKESDIVLITGGLGPTKDDITKQTLAEYFNMPLRLDQETLEHIKLLFKNKSNIMLDVNIKQAEVPEGCTVIKNKNGTAPCMWFEHNGKIIVSMPGVPYEMMYLMEEEIIPRIESKITNHQSIIHQTILTVGIGESYLAEKISDIENQLPSYIKLAYLPKLGQVRLRLTAIGTNTSKLNTEIAIITKEITERIGNNVAATTDIALEKVILDFMKSKNLTLSTAESCTGGYIAHLLTLQPGSSAVYQGGGVTYSNQLKQSMLGVNSSTIDKYGAVSEETVKEMAMGAILQFNTDYAISISGIAGPDGGSVEKPVGTVWIALANKHKQIKTKMFTFANKRQQNIEYSAIAALTMLFLKLKEDFN